MVFILFSWLVVGATVVLGFCLIFRKDLKVEWGWGEDQEGLCRGKEYDQNILKFKNHFTQ